MEFIERLGRFLFTPGQADLASVSYGYLIFAAASAFMGLVVVALDFVLFTLQRKSFLKLTYTGKRSILLFLLWGLGAGIGGFLGAVAVIFQMSLQASATVGIGWPLVLPRLLEASQKDEDTQRESKEEAS